MRALLGQEYNSEKISANIFHSLLSPNLIPQILLYSNMIFNLKKFISFASRKNSTKFEEKKVQS